MSMSTDIDQSEKKLESKSKCGSGRHSGSQSNDISHLSSTLSGKRKYCGQFAMTQSTSHFLLKI